MPIKFYSFDSRGEIIRDTMDLLVHYLTLTRNRPYAVMLSGGKTPLQIYQQLAFNPVPVSRQLHLLWSDERMVPSDSPESNLGNTQAMISQLGIPAKRLLSVKTHLPLKEAAKDYHHQIQAFLDKGGTLPLGLLGLGPDGHTASLFSVEDAQRDQEGWAIPVQRPTPPHRVSVTPSLLARFDRLIILLADPDKRDILRRLQEEPETIPAGWAVRNVDQVEVWSWLGGEGPIPSPQRGKDAY